MSRKRRSGATGGPSGSCHRAGIHKKGSLVLDAFAPSSPNLPTLIQLAGIIVQPVTQPFFDSIGQTETNDHVSGTSALDRTPEESANCRPGGPAPGAGISVPEKRPFSSRSRRRCYSSRYFFLGGVAIFMSERADSATFGFSFFGLLALLCI